MSVHLEITWDFYGTHMGASSFKDQPICLSCLMNVPEYVLPCNHILCKDCAIFQGNLIDWSDDRLIKSRQCPLDPSDEGETHIRLQKPDMGVYL